MDHTIPLRENQAVVGVDLGVKAIATLSDGRYLPNPQVLRSNLKKLARLNRSLARKEKGSKNRDKARKKIAKLYYRISCIRVDILHKATTYLTKNFTTIVLEDLNVRGMMKNRRLSRAISEVGFYEFRRQLEYKASLYGSTIVVADRWFPSSKKCSSCGAVRDRLELSERFWTCDHCGVEHDRDVNAAKNLENLVALSLRVTACCPESSGFDRKIETKLLVGQEPSREGSFT